MDHTRVDRQTYTTPQLTVYGDIAVLTHGGKGGGGGGGDAPKGGGHGDKLRS